MPGLLVQDTIQRSPEASDAQELTQVAAQDLLFLRWRNRQGLDAGDGLPGVALAVLAGVWRVCTEQNMVRPMRIRVLNALETRRSLQWRG